MFLRGCLWCCTFLNGWFLAAMGVLVFLELLGVDAIERHTLGGPDTDESTIDDLVATAAILLSAGATWWLSKWCAAARKHPRPSGSAAQRHPLLACAALVVVTIALTLPLWGAYELLAEEVHRRTIVNESVVRGLSPAMARCLADRLDDSFALHHMLDDQISADEGRTILRMSLVCRGMLRSGSEQCTLEHLVRAAGLDEDGRNVADAAFPFEEGHLDRQLLERAGVRCGAAA